MSPPPQKASPPVTLTVNGVDFVFCHIPQGTRGWVGARTTKNWNDDTFGEEDPVRLVTLEHDLWMMQTPVTQAQYRAVMGENFSHLEYVLNIDSRPVSGVSWWDALCFCQNFSRLFEGLQPIYRFEEASEDTDSKSVTWSRETNGFRLPTEDEWELACRAGTATEYHSGDGVQSLSRAGWFGENLGILIAQPVLTKTRNHLGLGDLHGNIMEWCWDALTAADGEFCDLPRRGRGLDHGNFRALRGGSCNGRAAWSRSAFRGRWNPGVQKGIWGFRVCLVRSPEGLRLTSSQPGASPAG